jgi:FkbM family methyltransferase
MINTRYGPMEIFEDDLGCSKILREYGEYSPLELAVMETFTKPGEVVLDIGAHIGAFARPLGLKDRKVYAVEPQTEVRSVLEKNIVGDTEIIPFAIGFKKETRHYTPNPQAMGSIRMEDEGSEFIQVIPLDDLQLRPKLIKIDVEGMELEVLAGGYETILRHRPYLLLERNNLEIPRFLTMLGYSVCPLDLPVYIPNNWNNNLVNHYPNMAHQMILAVPREKDIQLDPPRQI